MTRAVISVEAVVDELWLDLDELCQAAGVDRDWVQERSAAGLLMARSDASLPGGYGAATLRRIRRMVRLEREFDAAPELAALVADLEDEIARLRARLAALGIE
jgi:chaperone modulatory protein CbpM